MAFSSAGTGTSGSLRCGRRGGSALGEISIRSSSISSAMRNASRVGMTIGCSMLSLTKRACGAVISWLMRWGILLLRRTAQTARPRRTIPVPLIIPRASGSRSEWTCRVYSSVLPNLVNKSSFSTVVFPASAEFAQTALPRLGENGLFFRSCWLPSRPSPVRPCNLLYSSSVIWPLSPSPCTRIETLPSAFLLLAHDHQIGDAFELVDRGSCGRSSRCGRRPAHARRSG